MDHVDSREAMPILNSKYYEAPSVFTPENLLREARRQKGLAIGTVPAICVLDPDGDLVDHLHATNRARRHATWACYHTMLDTFVHDGKRIRYYRARGRRAVCGAGGRGTLRLRLPVSHQHHLSRADHFYGSSSLCRTDRESAA